jgi:hypothetical protein
MTGALKLSRCTSFNYIRRDDQFIPRHVELGALLLDNERSGRPLTDMIRAEHSESFDQEFTRATDPGCVKTPWLI